MQSTENTPLAGHSLMATRLLRAWVSDNEKGTTGLYVRSGDVGLVLQAWTVGKHVRIRMFVKGYVVMFSHVGRTVWINWLDVSGGKPQSEP